MYRISQFTQQELNQWAHDLTREMASFMQQEGVTVTHRTIKGIQQELRDFAKDVTKLEVQFRDVQRYVEA